MITFPVETETGSDTGVGNPVAGPATNTVREGTPTMRQLLTPVLCTFLLTIPAADTQAQQRTTDLILGAGATMGFATDEEATERRIGLNVAGGLSLRVIDMIGLRVEGGYIEKGAGMEVSEGGAAGHVNVELDYLALRGLLEIGGDFHVLAGASMGRDMQCNVVIDVSVEGTDLSSEQDCDEMSIDPNTDFGITAGAGYNIGPLGVTLLFTEGLTEIFANGDAPEGRNRTISLVGSVRIPIAG